MNRDEQLIVTKVAVATMGVAVAAFLAVALFTPAADAGTPEGGFEFRTNDGSGPGWFEGPSDASLNIQRSNGENARLTIGQGSQPLTDSVEPQAEPSFFERLLGSRESTSFDVERGGGTRERVTVTPVK